MNGQRDDNGCGCYCIVFVVIWLICWYFFSLDNDSSLPFKVSGSFFCALIYTAGLLGYLEEK